MYTPLGALSDWKQRRHLTGFKISEPAASPLVFMPNIAGPAGVLLFEPAKQIAHLIEHVALPVTFTHSSQIERSLPSGVRGQYSGRAQLSESRRISVLNGKIAQAVAAKPVLLP